ncbi:serine hydrolase domain-containing protein [Ekhidna sp.]
MKHILTSLLIGLTILSQAQLLDPKTKDELDELIQSQVQDTLAPGLAIGIVKDGKIIYEAYSGYADLKNSTPLDGTSRFNYASSGKQFTALAILTLIEKGDLKLDDDIRKYLPEFYPDVEEKIEIQHLITHTSGIRDIYHLWNLQGITWWEESLSNDDALKLLSKQEELSFKPGKLYLYSNSNYLILTEIIKQVTGISFDSFMRNLFNNLGMSDTAFEPNHEDIPKRVLPYGYWKRYRMYEWNADLIGDGALFTSLPNQLRWEAMLQNEKSDFLSKKSIKQSQKTIASSSITNYGYGLEFEEGKSFHHGSTGAYGATFARYSNENLSIVVMTNYSNIIASMITDKCYEILSGTTFPAPSPRKPQTIGNFVSVEELLGTYKTSGGYYYRFVERSDTLFLERTNREPVALEHEKGNIYHEINDPDFQQQFTIDPEVGMQVTAYYPTHDSYTLTKHDISWEDYDYAKLNGKYYSDELNVNFEVKHVSGETYNIIFDYKTYTIQAFEPNILWVKGFKADVVNGAFMLSSSRNLNMRFKKK